MLEINQDDLSKIFGLLKPWDVSSFVVDHMRSKSSL